MAKRLAYLDIEPTDLAVVLGLPDDAEIVGVGWTVDPPTLLLQVRSAEVPERKIEDATDADADHLAEHFVSVERDATGHKFRRKEVA